VLVVMWLDNDMNNNDIFSTARQFIATKNDTDLVEMMKLSDDRAIKTLIAEELINRHPEIDEALAIWEMDLEGTEELTDVVVRVMAA
jgi:hypothetical protein